MICGNAPTASTTGLRCAWPTCWPAVVRPTRPSTSCGTTFDTGRWPIVHQLAELLAGHGQAEEAIARGRVNGNVSDAGPEETAHGPSRSSPLRLSVSPWLNGGKQSSATSPYQAVL